MAKGIAFAYNWLDNDAIETWVLKRFAAIRITDKVEWRYLVFFLTYAT